MRSRQSIAYFKVIMRTYLLFELANLQKKTDVNGLSDGELPLKACLYTEPAHESAHFVKWISQRFEL